MHPILFDLETTGLTPGSALDRLQDLKLLTTTQARLSTQSIQYALPPVARASCPEPSSSQHLPA